MARVDVLWADEGGNPRVAPATLEDKSTRGVSIRIQTSVPNGTQLTIKRGSEQFSGTVTYCRSDRRGYVLGIQRDARMEIDPG